MPRNLKNSLIPTLTQTAKAPHTGHPATIAAAHDARVRDLAIEECLNSIEQAVLPIHACWTKLEIIQFNDTKRQLSNELHTLRFREQGEWRRIQAELNQYQAGLSQGREREAALRRLLEISFPLVESHAIAEHMLDGFRPQIRPLDKFVEEIRQALFMQETK